MASDLEARLAALEKEQFKPDDLELLRFLIRAVKAARGTIWLTNGVVKYLLPVVGIAWGFWHWGSDFAAWAARGFGR
jgi:hypothetical protein